MGAVAEAVGAVIAAQLQQDLERLGQPVPDSVAALLSRNAIAAVRQDGWHISPAPTSVTTTRSTT
ncbi:hypothetical protein ABZ605_08465 [Streptomyces sp. NPDC012765]|uniref:hypothetical protein n=1 Tax=Streptomyces sp. NPDC012765 TaxID=3155249 RepID=UPI0033DB5F91